jgi:multidrug efflux system outer membrane protein
MRKLTSLVLPALLACAVGPHYERPQAPVPGDYRFALEPKEMASVADVPWWEMYRDPALQALIGEALKANQDLALATARVEEARALVGVASAGLWPQVNLQATGLYGQQVSKNTQKAVGFPGTVGPYGSLGADVGLSWELDVWGKWRSAKDAAKADLLTTEELRRAVLLSLVSDVAQAYVELRSFDVQLEIAQRTTQARQATLELVEARSQGGVGNDLEVMQARANLAVSAAAIPASRRFIALRENFISALLGRPPAPVARATGGELPLPPALPGGVPAALLARRPDVVAAEQQAVAANARVGVAVANRLPSISLLGTVGLASASFSTLFSSDALTWSAGGGLFAPIFQGGRLSSEQEAAEARFRQSAATWRQTVLTAYREVSDAAVGVRELGLERQERVKEVSAAREAEQLALIRYEGGTASYLEVLDAQRVAFQAELDLVDTATQQLVSSVQLYRALGGGWQEPQAEAAAVQPASGAAPAAPAPAPST